MPSRVAEVWNGDQEGLGKEIIGSQKLGTHRDGREPALGPMVVDAGSPLGIKWWPAGCLMTAEGTPAQLCLGLAT